MKILLLTPFVPSPVAPAGCPRAVFDRLRLLATQHDVTVVCFADPDGHARDDDVTRVGARLETAPRSQSASRTVHRAMKRLRLAGGLVRPHRPMLVQEFSSARLQRRVRGALADGRPDLVLVEHILMAQHLTAVPADVPVVISDHDVRLALPRPPVHVHGLRSALDRYDAARWRAYVTRAYRRAEIVLVPTEEDAAWVSGQLPGVEPVVVPFGLVVDAAPVVGPRRDDVLLFVGNFSHGPNRDAAHWLVEGIMPRVRGARPDVHLWLVGADPTPDVRALAGPGVVVTGAVPSVMPYLASCTVFVAPLREGGGMRMKLLEALTAGTPVVTTTLGAAALDAVPGRDLLVADTAGKLAEAVLRLLGDPGLRSSLGSSGRNRVTPDLTARRVRLETVLQEARRTSRLAAGSP